MGVTTMGKVKVVAKLENLADVVKVCQGELASEQIRGTEVNDALIDTGASMLLAPKKLIEPLGLTQFRTRKSRGLGESLDMKIYGPVRLTIQGRDCTTDVGEIPDEFPVLIGQIPLEMMDWVVDPKGQKLIGNPEHGGEQVIEVFATVAKNP